MLLSKIRISGHSMLPTCKPGDIVLASSLPYVFSKPSVRDIIVFRHKNMLMIKRISKLTKKGFIVSGDNQTDSLEIGEITASQILGKVIMRL